MVTKKKEGLGPKAGGYTASGFFATLTFAIMKPIFKEVIKMGTLLLFGVIMMLIGVLVIVITMIAGAISLIGSAIGLISSVAFVICGIWLAYKIGKLIYNELVRTKRKNS